MASSLRFELPHAVFWDMDGTLIDTEPYWFAAEKRLVAAHGGTWSDEDCLALVGLHLPAGAKKLQAAGVKLSIEETVNALVTDVAEQTMENLIVRAGALELLQACAAANIPQALVTMSEDPLVSSVVQALEHRAGTKLFDVIVTGDLVTAGKPDPEAYELAHRRLQDETGRTLDPRSCLVIEDSPIGVGAGENSGMVTIAVPHTLPIAPTGRHIRWESLAGRSLEDLAGAIRQANTSLTHPH
ncbi:HAD family hydrolase [Micrococcoides hystricis]|uniref:HAD family hydrolase n=1 Tax=Micrococcoides hystricis TaxID=1572761 RepID=A0ABV6P791_9MICC